MDNGSRDPHRFYFLIDHSLISCKIDHRVDTVSVRLSLYDLNQIPFHAVDQYVCPSSLTLLQFLIADIYRKKSGTAQIFGDLHGHLPDCPHPGYKQRLSGRVGL